MAHIPTDVRRQQFIEAAIVVIARDGVDGATTRRIAEEAKAPLASLHYCFQTKENLLWSVFEHLADVIQAGISKSEISGKTSGLVAGRLVAETVRRAMEWPDANRAQTEIWLWAMRHGSDVPARLYDKFMGSSKALLQQSDTQLGDDELETVARVVVAVIDGLCMQLITRGDNELVMRETATATEILEVYLDQVVRRTA